MENVLNSDPQNVFYRCVEDSNEAIMITDTRGAFLYVNPAWCAIYGYARNEALGQNLRILHSGFHNSEFYREMWQAILDPKVGHWKGEVVNKSNCRA